MRIIEGILFDPVGSLADFPADEFEAIAIHMLGRALTTGASGSHAYWDFVNLLESRGSTLDPDDRAFVEACEIRAVDRAELYDDARPALAELTSLATRLIVASSLSEIALCRFLDRFLLHELFTVRASRDTAGGVRSAPISHALEVSGLEADRTLFLTDTAAGLQAAARTGVNVILMMNDPDEAMRLTACNPAGGIVSLHELADFVRLVAAQSARRLTGSTSKAR